MNEVVRKKLNLLVHLAKIDGKFHNTEREVLASMLNEAGITEHEYSDEVKTVRPEDFKKSADKTDLLYWAIRLIKADGEIHDNESAFCKALAVKLGFNESLITHYSKNDLGTKANFIETCKRFVK